MTKRYYKCEETHQTFDGVEHKRCTKCRMWKEESEFRKDLARKDGLRIYCKGCEKVYALKRRSKNKKAVREYLKFEDRHRVIRGFKETLCSCCKQWKYYKITDMRHSTGRGNLSDTYSHPTMGSISLNPPSTRNPIRTNIPY